MRRLHPYSTNPSYFANFTEFDSVEVNDGNSGWLGWSKKGLPRLEDIEGLNPAVKEFFKRLESEAK